MITINGNAVIGVGLAIAGQKRFTLRELWYSGGLKFIVTVFDRDDTEIKEAFLTRPNVSVSDMQDAIEEWFANIPEKQSSDGTLTAGAKAW